jgi:thiol-disulfide isomerase/thioredoxin
MSMTSRSITCSASLQVLLIGLTAIGLTTAGCDKSESSARATFGPARQDGARGSSAVKSDPAAAAELQRPDPSRLSASDILGRMVHAYHIAQSYADDAQLRIAIRRDGQSPGDADPLHASVVFARPNKLHVEYFDARMTADGKKIRASVSSVPQQVLELDAPEKLGIGNLFLGEAFNESLSNGPSGFPIQLVLLLDDHALASLLPDGTIGEVLSAAPFDGHDCLRVKVQTPAGPCTYWIDDKSYVLRLLELPTDSLRQQMEASEGPIKQLSVTLELLGARLNEPVPDIAFQFEIPTDVKLVKQLLRPPQPVSDLLGKGIGDFKFAGINCNPTSRTSSAGKVTILEFWFTGCDPCRETFPQLAKVHEKYKGSDRVSIVGVSVDRPEVEDAKIQELAAAWGASFPLARDTTDGFQTAFHGLATPALFVIGPDGTVQYNEVGWNPELANELPTVIDAILAGKSTWEDAKRRGDGRIADYERKIQEPPAPVAVVENLPDTKILPRDEPTSIKLSKAWEITEFKAPGNLLIVEADGAEPRVLVMDGPRTVVELTRDGKIAGRHPLQIPEQAVISFLRTAVDGQGHRFFAGSASGQQQVFVFDADWKLLFAFPPADQPKHAGIGDVQFVDLDQSGSPKLAIGYWGLVGVQQIALDGKRLWSDRSMEFVLSLAEGGADAKGARHLLCANSRGSLVPIDAGGTPLTEWRIPGLMLETVQSAKAGREGHSALCAIASNAEGTPLAVGLGPNGEDQWRYILPRGIFRTPVEKLTSANVLGDDRQWLVAGADGSIHFVSQDGTPIDHFHYGEALTGLAGIRYGDDTLLLVSTAKRLVGWRVERK